MSLTISFGWWLLPAIVTISAFAAYALWEAKQPAPSGRDFGAGAVISLMAIGGAVIVSLVAWLVWAVARLTIA